MCGLLGSNSPLVEFKKSKACTLKSATKSDTFRDLDLLKGEKLVMVLLTSQAKELFRPTFPPSNSGPGLVLSTEAGERHTIIG